MHSFVALSISSFLHFRQQRMKMLEKSSIHKKGEIYRLILGMSEQYNINMYILKKKTTAKGNILQIEL